MKGLTFAEFCSLFRGQKFEIVERDWGGYHEFRSILCSLQLRTYKVDVPVSLVEQGEYPVIFLDVTLWEYGQVIQKITFSYNQCGYLKNQDFVLEDESEMMRLLSWLKGKNG